MAIHPVHPPTTSPSLPSAPTTTPEVRRSATSALVAYAAGLPAGRPARHLVLNEVVSLNRGVAQAVAARYRRRGVDDDDLDQAAFEGLVKAVRRFDPERSPDLLTFAVPTIRGELQRHFRDRTWSVRPPRAMQEMESRVRRESDRLMQVLGHEPTVAELADSLAIDVDVCAEALNTHGAYSALSLDRPVQVDGGEDGDLTLGSHLSEDAGYDRVDDVLTLGPLVQRLKPRARLLLQLRYGEELTQREIGDRLGLTQTHVSRLLRRTLDQLRGELGAA